MHKHLFLFILLFSVNVVFAQSQKKLEKAEHLLGEQNYTEAYTILAKLYNDQPYYRDSYSERNERLECMLLQCFQGGVPYSNKVLCGILESLLTWGSEEGLKLYLDNPKWRTTQTQQYVENAYWTKSNAYVNFLLARFYAGYVESNKEKEALAYLQSAIEKGFRDKKTILETQEFEQLNDQLFCNLLLAKKIISPEDNYIIKRYVEREINLWQKKGKFEKTADYELRVSKDNRLKKINEYTQHYIDSFAIMQYDLNIDYNVYDADNETFKIFFKSGDFVLLKVSISEAPDFDRYLKEIKIQNIHFTLRDGKYELLSCTFVNTHNKKSYNYHSSEVAAFNSSSLSLKFEEITIESPQENSKNKNNSEVTTAAPESEVDTNIPTVKFQNKNKFALIIGNEDYKSFQSTLSVEQNVPHAIHDARVFKEYCIKTLGVPEGNIIYSENAGAVRMKQDVNKIRSVIKNTKGKAEVLVYFAGHGYAHESSKKPYLIPVDVSGNSLDFALSQEYLFEALTEFPAQKVLVFLDACFSGGGRNLGLVASRGVKIVPKENQLSGNLVVFCASSGEQSALAYGKMKHGMFTYFLLKKLQETKGEANLKELEEYLKTNTAVKSTLEYSREQNPCILLSTDVIEKWKSWTL